MNELTIKTLPIELSGKLNNDLKNKLIILIENEISNRMHVDTQKFKEAEEKVIQQYKKENKVELLIERCEKLDEEESIIKKRISDFGFDISGNKLTYLDDKNELKKKLDKLKAVNSDIITNKNKIVTRLLLATTYGEAVVIMREILGNSLIPTLTQPQLTMGAKNE